MHRCLNLGLIASLILAAFGGCQRSGTKIAPSEIPTIPVSRPVERSVTDFVDYTGRTNAKNAVSIQPRVTGYLKEMPFREGADVKKGELLFVIDPRPYEAQLEAAKAQVALNQAGLNYAKATNERFKALAKTQPAAVSERELDQYRALEDQAIANLDLARANLVAAQLNLDWTKVTSPIDGYISRYYLTIGNLVNQDVTQLTTLVSMDPMYAYFDMDEPTFLRINRAINDGTIVPVRVSTVPLPVVATSTVGFLGAPFGRGPSLTFSGFLAGTAATNVPVLMGLQGEEGYPHRGTINFVDNQVNPGTGSIPVRGVFENPKPAIGRHLLVPGMFVHIRLPIGQPQDALLVIDRAVTSDQGIKYVYVVDAENKVQSRRVTVGPLQEDGLRVITQGLDPKDWVVVGGLQQVRPKMEIQPDHVTMPTLAAPAERTAPPPGAGKAKQPAGKGKR